MTSNDEEFQRWVRLVEYNSHRIARMLLQQGYAVIEQYEDHYDGFGPAWGINVKGEKRDA